MEYMFTNQGQSSEPLPVNSSPAFSDADTAAATTSQSDEEVVLLAATLPKKKAGRRVFKETRHPVYRGVRRRNNNKWVCELREPNKKSRIWLGTYPTPEMAARAHDVAALALRGKSACLNFADSAWRLPVPASKDASDIRKTAAEAAKAFRPREVVSDEEEKREKNKDGCWFMDEEEVFDMPGLLANMAEGLLLSPPPPPPPLGVGDDIHDHIINWDDDVAPLSLWHFPF